MEINWRGAVISQIIIGSIVMLSLSIMSNYAVNNTYELFTIMMSLIFFLYVVIWICTGIIIKSIEVAIGKLLELRE